MHAKATNGGYRVTKFDQALAYAIQEIGNWKYRNYIKKICLYGSCARNEQRADSDIDLYLELEAGVPMKELRALKISCNPDDWRLPDVELKIDIGENENRFDDLFHKNIQKEGVVLWERK